MSKNPEGLRKQCHGLSSPLRSLVSRQVSLAVACGHPGLELPAPARAQNAACDAPTGTVSVPLPPEWHLPHARFLPRTGVASCPRKSHPDTEPSSQAPPIKQSPETAFGRAGPGGACQLTGAGHVVRAGRAQQLHGLVSAGKSICRTETAVGSGIRNALISTRTLHTQTLNGASPREHQKPASFLL